MASERMTISSRIERPNIYGSPRERKKGMVAKMLTMNVVNLIPDAVDALPAPMNMSTMVNKSVGSSSTA